MSSETIEKRNAIRSMPCTKGRSFPVEVLTSDEVQALLAACGRRSPSGIRNRALVVVLWRGGLRVQEALDLRPRDIDLDQGLVNVRHGKGEKQRIVGIDAMAIAVIEQWLFARSKLGIGGQAPLFAQITSGRLGEPLSQSYVRQALKRLARSAGIEKRVHPHGLRHTLASSLANEGAPLHLVQAQLGHSSLATTERYIARIAPTELATAMRDRAW